MLFVLLFSLAHAASLKIPLNSNEQFHLVFAKAQVSVSPSTEGALSILTQGACRELVQDKKDKDIYVKEQEVFKPRSESEVCQIQIGVPNGSQGWIQISDGQANFQKVKSNLTVSMPRGRVTIKDGSGDFSLQMQKGDFLIQGFQGELKTDLGTVNVSLKDSQGDFTHRVLAGDTGIEKYKGQIKVDQAGGGLKILGGSGSVQVQASKAQVQVQNFLGRIDGIGVEGNWILNLAADPEVNIKTESGRVSVTVPPASGALAHLVTEEGEMVIPAGFNVIKTGSQKSFRGRLKGEVGKGFITVRAQEGSIALK